MIVEITTSIAMPSVAMILASNCDKISVYQNNLGQHGLAFAYSKNFSVYGNLISNAMQTLTERGKLKMVEENWIQKRFCLDKGPTSQQFEWTYFSGLLLVAGITTSFCIILFLLENLYVYLDIRNSCSIRQKKDVCKALTTEKQYLSIFRKLSTL